MAEMDKYYYSDAVYELELNLHNVRRELIAMLEVFEETDCSDCFQIKCKCVKELSTTSKISDSGNSYSSKKELGNEKANEIDEMNENKKALESEPEPELKPETELKPEPEPKPEPKLKTEDESAGPSTPEKETVIKNIEAWIEASSKAVDEESKPVSINLKESFLQVRKEKKETQKKNFVTHANAVEAFFKYFKVPPTSTNVTYVSAKLAAACSSPSGRSYSYF